MENGKIYALAVVVLLAMLIAAPAARAEDFNFFSFLLKTFGMRAQMSVWAPHQGITSVSRSGNTITIGYSITPGTSCCNNLDTFLQIIRYDQTLGIDQSLCGIYQGNWDGVLCNFPFSNADITIISPNSRPANVEYKVEPDGSNGYTVRIPTCDPCGCTFQEAADVLHTCTLYPTFTGTIKIQPTAVSGQPSLCGNGVCDAGETGTCPNDCPSENETQDGDGTIPPSDGSVIQPLAGIHVLLFFFLFIFLILAATAFLFYRFRNLRYKGRGKRRR